MKNAFIVVIHLLFATCLTGVANPAPLPSQTDTATSRIGTQAKVTGSSPRIGNDAAPECRLATPPAFCHWSKEKLQQVELSMVDDMRKRLEIEFKYLKPRGLMGSSSAWHFQPSDPDYAAYCNSKLELIRTKQYEIFPKPDIKTSEAGLDAFGKMWLESMQKPPGRPNREELAKKYLAGKFMDPQDKNHRFAKSRWLYQNRLGFSTVDFVHAQKYMETKAIEFQAAKTTLSDDATGAGMSSRKGTATPYVKGAFGIVKLAGEAFHATAGTLYWQGTELKDDDLGWVVNREEFNECDEQWRCSSRIFILHPIDAPPWLGWITQRNYRNSSDPADQDAAETLRNHACQWWIE